MPLISYQIQNEYILTLQTKERKRYRIEDIEHNKERGKYVLSTKKLTFEHQRREMRSEHQINNL